MSRGTDLRKFSYFDTNSYAPIEAANAATRNTLNLAFTQPGSVLTSSNSRSKGKSRFLKDARNRSLKFSATSRSSVVLSLGLNLGVSTTIVSEPTYKRSNGSSPSVSYVYWFSAVTAHHLQTSVWRESNLARRTRQRQLL